MLSRLIPGNRLAPAAISNTEFVQWEPVSGSQELIVFFGSRGATKFEFRNVFKGSEHHKLHLRETGYRWFLDGVPGFAGSLSQLATVIGDLMKSIGAKRTTLVGSSMGAYAALYVGSAVRAQRVLAFSPQTVLHSGWEFTPEDVTLAQVVDLPAMIAKAKQTQFDVICSSEFLDVYHAARLRGLGNVAISIRKSGHNVLGNAHSYTGIVPFIESHIAGRGLPVKGLGLDKLDHEQGLREFLNLFYERKFKDACAVAKRIMLCEQEWFDAKFMVGKCFYELKDFSSAVPFLVAANRLDHMNTAVYVPLIASYAGLGQTERAEGWLADFVLLLKATKQNVPTSLERVAAHVAGAGDKDLAARIKSRANEYLEQAS